jgi:hypothetical protein
MLHRSQAFTNSQKAPIVITSLLLLAILVLVVRGLSIKWNGDNLPYALQHNAGLLPRLLRRTASLDT